MLKADRTWSQGYTLSCPKAQAEQSAGLMRPFPTDGWHCPGSGRRRVHLSPALGVGAAAVCAVVQSLWCSQVRHSLLLGAHGETIRSKITDACHAFRIQNIHFVIMDTLNELDFDLLS